MRRVIGLITVLTAFVAWILITTAVAANAITITSTNVNVNGWAFDETRATGHYQYTGAGLHIWTEGTTGTDKVAGYVSVSTSLSAVAAGPAPTMDYENNMVSAPGLQLVVFDPNTGHNFILVGESIYTPGDLWWIASCSTFCESYGMPTGATGHPEGTLAAWNSVMGDEPTSVVAFGFSLGSGAHGDGTIKSMSLDGIVYRFCYESPTTTTTTTESSSSTTTTTTGSSSSHSTSATTTTTTKKLSGTRTSINLVQGKHNTGGDGSGAGTTNLAYTGGPSPVPLVVTASVLLLAGGALLFAVRRTRTRG